MTDDPGFRTETHETVESVVTPECLEVLKEFGFSLRTIAGNELLREYWANEAETAEVLFHQPRGRRGDRQARAEVMRGNVQAGIPVAATKVVTPEWLRSQLEALSR